MVMFCQNVVRIVCGFYYHSFAFIFGTVLLNLVQVVLTAIAFIAFLSFPLVSVMLVYIAVMIREDERIRKES